MEYSNEKKTNKQKKDKYNLQVNASDIWQQTTFVCKGRLANKRKKSKLHNLSAVEEPGRLYGLDRHSQWYLCPWTRLSLACSYNHEVQPCKKHVNTVLQGYE